ncbi:MAG: hypothetical protein ACRDP1_03165 [Nocardioidaceae bacterium]
MDTLTSGLVGQTRVIQADCDVSALSGLAHPGPPAGRETCAAAHGFSFVNPESAFVGHAVCDSPEWLNGLSYPVMESYHPNRSGQEEYADLVDGYLGSAEPRPPRGWLRWLTVPS